jgi:hypothetical protein
MIFSRLRGNLGKPPHPPFPVEERPAPLNAPYMKHHQKALGRSWSRWRAPRHEEISAFTASTLGILSTAIAWPSQSRPRSCPRSPRSRSSGSAGVAPRKRRTPDVVPRLTRKSSFARHGSYFPAVNILVGYSVGKSNPSTDLQKRISQRL